ncbi:KOW-like protein, partial [Cynara cardunculus var. scolymus]
TKSLCPIPSSPKSLIDDQPLTAHSDAVATTWDSRFPASDWHIMGWKAAQKLIHHWKILRGDNVMIIRGKDKGATGTIKRVIRSQNRVIVEGKNLVKKHIKQGQGHEGGIFTVEAPLHVSNVQIVDPVTRYVGTRYQEDGTKVRVSRAGPKDTPIELVHEKTYDAKTGKGMPDL